MNGRGVGKVLVMLAMAAASAAAIAGHGGGWGGGGSWHGGGWGGGGGWHGGGWHGGYYHGGYYRGGYCCGASVGFYFGPGFAYGYPYPYYGYPYYGYPYAYPYGYPYGPAADVTAMPTQYIEQGQAGGGYDAGGGAGAPQMGYWYHCARPEGYYPYVKSCPGGWAKVPAQPPAN